MKLCGQIYHLVFAVYALVLSGVRVNGRTVRKTKEASATQLFRQIDIDLHPYVKSGISKAMIEGVYCGLEDGGFRVQIKDNKIYIAGEALGIQSRNRNVKLHLLGVAMRYPNLPEVDFIVGTGDCPGRTVHNVSGMSAGGPVFAQAKRTEHTNAILYPDHTFTDWQEASTASWEQEKFLIQQAAKSYPWSTRTPQLLFRGNSVTRNGNIAADLQPSAELDVRVWDWIQDRQGFLGLAEHCKNKYLLNWPGNSYSARYKYLLLCGSVVLHGDNGYYEFFYPMLKDGLNIVKTQGLDSKEDLEFGLKSLVQQLEADPMLAHCIALAGQQFAANVLTDDNLTEYWFRLLEAYAELQRHSVELSEDAVILSSSLSNPEYVDIKHRSGCSS